MDKAELLVYIKNSSIKNLVCVAEVTSEQERENLNHKGYLATFKADEWRTTFPRINVENIFYNTGIEPIFYFDKENYILFPIYLCEELPNEKFENEILRHVERLKRETAADNFQSLLFGLQDRMRMEMLNVLIENKASNQLYELFQSFYPSSDYDCNVILPDTMKKLNDLKTPKQTEHTLNHIKDMPQIIGVYRGQGELSTDWEQAVSWTTDINIANFFASRFAGNSGVIYTAEANKSDIIEYFEGEKECIILPENIRLKSHIFVYGLDLLNEQLPKVTEMYQSYRDWALDNITFNIDNNEYGKLHTLRVLLNCLLLSSLKGLTQKEMDILCTAAIFHDTMRTSNGEDSKHGADAAEYYKKYAAAHPECISYAKITEQLIKYHSFPDKFGQQAISSEEQHLLAIFKDAAALDRVRFGIRALDLRQLRTKEALGMSMAANKLVDAVRVPEFDIKNEMELT